MSEELPSSHVDVHAMLMSAVSKRAFHIRRESQTITMANVRRLLENDLGLETASLDAHKTFIRQLVDEALLSSDNAADQEEEKAVAVQDKPSPSKVPKAAASLKRPKKIMGKKAREESVSEELNSEDTQGEDDMHVEAPKKKKQKKHDGKKERAFTEEMHEDDDHGSHAEVFEESSDVLEAKKKKKKKRKEQKKSNTGTKEMDEDIREDDVGHVEMSEEGGDVVEAKEKKKKQQKMHEGAKEKAPREKMDEDEGRDVEASEEDSDVVEAKKPKKALPKAASVKSATIDNLKKTIKECGLGIPPSIYKKAKQLPDHKQEAFIIKELEDILSRHGLPSNPTEKEIKAAKRKIAREKDMEGIDMSNIITEPRGRRAASQWFAPVYKPPLPVEYDSEEEDGSAEDGDEVSEDDGNNSAEGEEGGGGDGGGEDAEEGGGSGDVGDGGDDAEDSD